MDMELFAEELSNSVQSIELGENNYSTDTNRFTEERIFEEISATTPKGYRLSHCLSEGVSGRVYLVTNSDATDCFAAKVVSIDGSFSYHSIPARTNNHLRDGILREYKIQKELQHPNIAAIYALKNTRNFSVMYMELIPCGDLFERIPLDIGLHIQQMFQYYFQILSALDYLHNEKLIAHLDIKPENIMLTRKDRAKLIDFGWAVDLKTCSKFKGLMGTKVYAPPEAWTCGFYAGPPADLFSLGVTFVTAVTGMRIWNSANAESDDVYRKWLTRSSDLYQTSPFDRLPADFVNFLIRTLAHDPNDRLTIPQIRKHPWFQLGLKRRLTPVSSAEKADRSGHDKENLRQFNQVPQSQPIAHTSCNLLQKQTQIPLDNKMILSQPLDIEGRLLATQLQPVEDKSASKRVKVAHLLKRMTRFFSSLGNEQHTMEVIRAVIAQHSYLRMTVRGPCNLLVEIRQPDLPLTVFRLLLYRLSGSIMADFRRVSGDGLLFHRIYAVIVEELKQIGAVNDTHPYLAQVLPETLEISS
ncbi:Serine/threonine-protein kinase Chk1 [Cichlidogyrus casuarinus]|uniref:Serine/threonine-protein kinase Chk1 n=1 Tax=Cichlidogyrus casuarinus TaxID=1844966 RepID=A0ABD2QAW9_9PLAT